MYEFWFDYVKPKYGEKVKLCYIDRNNIDSIQGLVLRTQMNMKSTKLLKFKLSKNLSK